MNQCLFAFLILLFLLSGCVSITPPVSETNERESNPPVSVLPTEEPVNPTENPPSPKTGEISSVSGSVSEESRDKPFVVEAAVYTDILAFYREFVRCDGDWDVAINKLYDGIASVAQLTDEQKKWELWCSCVDARDRNLGYAIRDLNGDGTPELIVISEDFIHAIYALNEDILVLVGGYWNRHSCAMGQDGILFISASSGAGDNYFASYRFASSGQEFQLIEMVGMETYDEQTGESFPESRCYRIQDGIKAIIDYDEACILWEDFLNVYSDNNPTRDAGLVINPL